MEIYMADSKKIFHIFILALYRAKNAPPTGIHVFYPINMT